MSDWNDSLVDRPETDGAPTQQAGLSPVWPYSGRLWQSGFSGSRRRAASAARPAISGTDEGIWRSMRLVPFHVSIPKPERDKTVHATFASQ